MSMDNVSQEKYVDQLVSNIGINPSTGLLNPVVSGSHVAVVAAPTGVAATDRAAIQAAIDALPAAGGTVLLGHGTYVVEPIENPAFAGFFHCVRTRKGVALVGAGIGATTIKLKDSANFTGHVISNGDLDGGDFDLTFRDFELDGNGANQTTLYTGLQILRVRGARCTRVRVKNVRGTSDSPPGETLHFAPSQSSDLIFTDCEALGTAGTQGSGFGDNNCTNVAYKGCIARAMSAAFGFASFQGRNITYSDCFSQKNGNAGFNIEFGEDIALTNCIAGGRAVAEAAAEPFAANESLGNVADGFICNATKRMELTNCHGTYNGGNGLNVVPTAADRSDCRVIGGAYDLNLTGGIRFGDLTEARNSFVSRETRAIGNPANNAFVLAGAGGPGAFGDGISDVLATPAVPASGVAQTNNFPFDVKVYLWGGAVSFVTIEGANLILTSGTFVVHPGATIAVTYGTLPTWSWWRA